QRRAMIRPGGVDAGGQRRAEHAVAGKAMNDPPVEPEGEGPAALDRGAGKQVLGGTGQPAHGLAPYSATSEGETSRSGRLASIHAVSAAVALPQSQRASAGTRKIPVSPSPASKSGPSDPTRPSAGAA